MKHSNNASMWKAVLIYTHKQLNLLDWNLMLLLKLNASAQCPLYNSHYLSLRNDPFTTKFTPTSPTPTLIKTCETTMYNNYIYPSIVFLIFAEEID